MHSIDLETEFGLVMMLRLSRVNTDHGPSASARYVATRRMEPETTRYKSRNKNKRRYYTPGSHLRITVFLSFPDQQWIV